MSRGIKAREQLSLALEKAQEEAGMQQEALANQVNSLFAMHLSSPILLTSLNIS